MGHKKVCFNCRKSFNISYKQLSEETTICPQCGGGLIYLNQKFQPPSQEDIKSWTVAEFLYKNGFAYQHVYKNVSLSMRVDEYSSANYVPYPKTMKEAIEFVEVYKGQARRPK
jgi:hypothetical protein